MSAYPTPTSHHAAQHTTGASSPDPLAALLDSLEDTGVSLSVRGGRLVCDAPPDSLTLALKHAIAAHRAALLALLAPPDGASSPDPREGLDDSPRLACNRGARHYPYWLLVPATVPDATAPGTPLRWLCRLCEPVTARAYRQAMRQRSTVGETVGELATLTPATVATPASVSARHATRAALLAWGAAHDYPALPFAFASGASTGAPAPFKTLAADVERWRAFTDGAGWADITAACRVAGIDTPTPPTPGNAGNAGGATSRASSSRPSDTPSSSPSSAGASASGSTRRDAPDTSDAPERYDAYARKGSPALAVIDSETDTGAVWIVRPGEAPTRYTGAAPDPAQKHAGDILTWARAHHIAQVWITPRYCLAAGLPSTLPRVARDTPEDARPRYAWLEAASADGWNIYPDTLTYDHAMTAYQPGTYGRVALLLPIYDRRTPWREAPDGETLARALALFRDSLAGYGWQSSPGATGTGLLRHLHGRNAASLDISASASPQDFPAPARAVPAIVPGNVSWIRPLTDGERSTGAQGAYVHVYDKNAMYLGACSALAVGMGVAEHLTASADDPAGIPFEKHTPGYWLARIDGAAIPAVLSAPWGDAPHMPPGNTGKLADVPDGYRWYLTPHLTIAGELGASLHIREAYVWREHARPFEPWYKRLRDARAHLQTQAASGESANDPAALSALSASLALRALKRVYATTSGWLDRRKAREGATPEDLYRPDWRHAITAQAACNLYRNLASVYARSGRAPFAVSIDSVCYVSASPDPLADVPDGLRIGDGIGAYKVKATFPLAALAPTLEALAAGTLTRDKAFSKLNAALVEHARASTRAHTHTHTQTEAPTQIQTEAPTPTAESEA